MTATELIKLLSDLRPEALPSEDIPPLLARLAAVQSALMVSWSMASGFCRAAEARQHDELLSTEQAAQRLNVSVDYVYRNARKMSFTIREGRLLRFSANGIDEYIRSKVQLRERRRFRP